MRVPVSGLLLFGIIYLSYADVLRDSVFAQSQFPGHESSGFIYETAPFPQCHASTLAETPAGLIAAWFGGTQEKHQDVGIWVARRIGGQWTTPIEVANGVQSESLRHPCWNPVLFQVPGGPLQLYYKVGPSPSEWWGMVRVSTDLGVTWGPAKRLPEKILGPIKNKPVMLSDGRIVSGSSTEHDGWRVHIESTVNLGFSWSRVELTSEDPPIQAIQPTVFVHPERRLQILCRTRGTGTLVEAWSNDNGRKWSALKPIALPNSNTGIDGVTLSDGRQLLVYNHTTRGRTPLNLAISPDGVKWFAAGVLEASPGEYSYPAAIQTVDGKVHISYTWQRQRIRHVELDPARLALQEIKDGQWPAR